MEIENIACPLCGSRRYKTTYTVGDFRHRDAERRFNLVKCENCNFKFVNPRPGENSLSELYKDNFYEPGSPIAYRILRPLLASAHSVFFKRIQLLIKPGDRILDIGCGNAEILAVLAKKGYEVYGVEPSSQASAYFPENVREGVQ